MAIHAPTDRRERRRAKVMLAGRIYCLGRSAACHVRSLSLNGAAISGARLQSGTAVMFEIARYGRFPAAVAWTDEDRAGLAFIEGRRAGLERILPQTPGFASVIGE